MAELERVTFSVSHTTRPPRAGEQEGRDYFFTGRQVFETMRQQDFFLEWAEVHGNLYGTSRKSVRSATEQGLDVILDIDVQGARQVRANVGLNGVFIFIAPPSLAELRRRLTGRSTEFDAVIAQRLANAEQEMQCIGNYEYVIVNDTVDKAAAVLTSIIIAERSRKRRGPAGEPLMLDFKEF